LQCDLKSAACLLCLNYADKIPIKATHQTIGGNAANIAIGGKRLNLKTAIYTELGNDFNGQVVKKELQKNRVDCRLVKMLKKQDTRFSIVLSYASERTILSSQFKRNYQPPNFLPTQWLYYTSLSAGFEKIQDKITAHLKKHPQTKLAVNPGSYQMRKNPKKFQQILPLTDLLFINKEEAELIAGKKANSRQLIKLLQKKGVKNVVLTDGTAGSFASDNDKIYFAPASPLKAVEKTGAGDAYAAGFLSAIIKKKNVPLAMKWGTINAGSVIQKIGAQAGLLTEKQMRAATKNYKLS
jgi:ribokinase